MARLEDKIDEVVFGSLKLIREYLQMERALQRISERDPKGDTCPTSCGCIGCIAREALPK